MFDYGKEVKVPLEMKYVQGFVLVTVMLFLSVLSLLMISNLNVDWLEIKASGFYWDKIRSFYTAEEELIRLERQLLAGANFFDRKKSK